MNINTNPHYNKLFYINKNSLSNELCKEMIQKFEKDNHRYDGVTASGLNKKIKDSTDLLISRSESWDLFNKTLTNELEYNIKEYLNGLNVDFGDSYHILNDSILHVYTMQIQKYNTNVGHYIYHNDSQYNWEKHEMRQVTFLWYLNDVEEGGETEFWKDIKVKPEAGKLILFPAHWSFPHRAHTPISNVKYILTGWAYEKYGQRES